MPVAPISPDVACAPVDIDAHVTEINAFLAPPWSNDERLTGRHYTVGGMTLTEVEAVVFLFLGAGWNVALEGEHLDSGAIVFRPRGGR